MNILRIALDVPLPRLFDYLAPESDESDIGRRVIVPFGKGSKTGMIISLATVSEQPDAKLKTVTEILRDMPALPDEWLALCEFCARYYQTPLGEVTSFALPPMLRRGKLPRMKKSQAPAIAVAPAPTARDSVPGAGDGDMTPGAVLPQLMAAQQAAVTAIVDQPGFHVMLLHGVTGSGKTEVYLRAIDAVLAQSGQALMLVPEIALTPQLEGRVAARFPAARVVCANSGMGDAARARGFLEALTGRAEIVLGTRLAVFMPLPRLRLIVVDEEHDASFKQQEGLRYSARDVAIWRAHQLNIPIVLGSATPSLETFHHASTGRYRMLELPERAVAEAMPAVRIVDTRREKLQEGLSAALLAGLQLRLERGEQSLVFLNRRGYAPVLACPPCGWISRCQRCAANLVLHLADGRLRASAPTAATSICCLSAAAPSASKPCSSSAFPRRACCASTVTRRARRPNGRRCSPPSTPGRPTSWSAPRCWPRATTFRC